MVTLSVIEVFEVKKIIARNSLLLIDCCKEILLP